MYLSYSFTDSNSRTAYGVLFEVNNLYFMVKANREVILSAGSIQSPQLLMLSGIGPRKHLEEMEIPVIYNSPGVGRNLQDHVGIEGINYLVTAPDNFPCDASIALNDQKIVSPKVINQFIFNHTGELYSNIFGDAVGFINSR